MAADEKFCPGCGKSAIPGSPKPPKKLVRLMHQKKIAGVCAGVARYLDADVTLVRVIWLVLVFAGVGTGLIAYIVAWIAMPKDYGVPASAPGHEPSYGNR
ncbi:MAG: PspC domain-containing protein [Bryobacteraceae bacterium]